jgi:hypothetical protein
MKNLVRYFVAKFVPDLRRMEPRNVGVVVWSEGRLAARFAGEKADQPGDVDGRTVPAFVTSLAAYKQWIRYWRKELEKPSVRPLQGGEPVPRTSPDFLTVLAGTSKGNFHLVDGGILLDPVPDHELPALAEHLYTTLVDEPAPLEEPRDSGLDDRCARLIEETRVHELACFHRNYPVRCSIGGQVEETFEFSFAYGDGTPARLYQQLPLPGKRNRRALSRNVHHIAWMFEKVIAAGIILPEQGGILVYPTEEQSADRDVQRAFSVLSALTRILSLREYDKVREEFQNLSVLCLSHHGD